MMGEVSKRIGQVNQEIERERSTKRYNVSIYIYDADTGDNVNAHLQKVPLDSSGFTKNPLLKEVLYSLLETQLKAVDDSTPRDHFKGA